MKKIATLGIITRCDRVLLGRRQGGSNIGEGKLAGPGGKLKPGETPLACVLREVEEEVGIKPDTRFIRKCAVITFYSAGEADYEVHVYRIPRFIGEPLETKEMAPSWYYIDNLPFGRMFESDRRWLPLLIKGWEFNASVYYEKPGEGFLDFKSFPFVG